MAAKCLNFCKSAPRLVVAHESCNLDQSCQTLPPYKVRDFVVSETTLLLLKEKIATKTCNLSLTMFKFKMFSDQVGLSNSVAVTLPLAQNWIEAVQVYVKKKTIPSCSAKFGMKKSNIVLLRERRCLGRNK